MNPAARVSIAERASSGPTVLLVEDDWRTRRFIRTVLRYSMDAHVVESAGPVEALAARSEGERPIDILIAKIECGSPMSGAGLAHAITCNNPMTKVLLISGKQRRPINIPEAWRFLSIPFTTAALMELLMEQI